MKILDRRAADYFYCHHYPGVNPDPEMLQLRLWRINQSNALKDTSVKRRKLRCVIEPPHRAQPRPTSEYRSWPCPKKKKKSS